MAYIPYGYKVVDSQIVVDETAAESLRVLYASYVSGLSVAAAAAKAGIEVGRTSAKRMLTNDTYLGNEHFPVIFDRETFEAAGAEMARRAELDGRPRFIKKTFIPAIYKSFSVPLPEENHETDPYRQAEYAYSLITPEEWK